MTNVILTSRTNIKCGDTMKNEDVFHDDKTNRVLSMYSRLLNGEKIFKAEEMNRFGIQPKTFQRDIDTIRAFLSNQVIENACNKQIAYDRTLNAYYIRDERIDQLTNSEILAVCKILLESRAFCKSEIETIIHKLLNECVPKSNQGVVRSLILNEMFHYVEPHHRKRYVESLWNIGTAVQEHRKMQITYEKQDGSVVSRTIKPVGIMFSEYYFYLTAFIEGIDKKSEFDDPDDLSPTIYRIDRIQSATYTNERFKVPYRERFEEGEFRKRVQFMYGGKLRRIKFLYTGPSLEAILDRLPTAHVLGQSENGMLIEAEVFGNGIDMWIRSQGNYITIVK